MGRISALIFLILASLISMQAAQQLVLVDDRYQTALNTAIILNPYENDILHNSCQTTPPTIVQSPKNGKIEILDGTTLLRYTPEIGFNGNDTIVYSIDCRHNKENATIILEIYEPLSSEGKNFYLTFLANLSGNTSYNREFSTIIFCRQDTKVFFENPLTGWKDSVEVKAGKKKQFILPEREAYLNKAYDQKCAKGIHVTSEAPISLYLMNFTTNSYDGSIVLPTSALGDEYIIQSYTGQLAGAHADIPYEPLYPSTCGIIATEDNTRIDIVPSVPLRENHQIGQSFQINLKRGEVYQLATDVGCAYPLTGTTVCSNKNVAIFTGCDFTTIPTKEGISGDHIVEQLIPTKSWGKSFAAVNTHGQSVDILQITALEDRTEGTKLSINGTVVATLKCKETYTYRLSASDKSVYIEADHPVCCYQYLPSYNVNGDGNCDPSMMQIVPLEQTISRISFGGYTISPEFESDQPKNYVTIITAYEDKDYMLLDGHYIGSHFKPVVGTDKWWYAVEEVNDASHTLLNNHGGFVAYLYGLVKNASYAYNLGYDVLPLNAYITIDNELSSTERGGTKARYTKQEFEFGFHFSSEYTDVHWILGDGTESNEETIKHIFSGQGEYPITLVVGRTTPICEDRTSDTIRTTLYLVGPDTISLPVTLCNGGFYEYKSNHIDTLLTQGGRNQFKFTDIYDQDSIVNIDVQLLESFFHADSAYICDNQQFHWEEKDTILKTPGIYTDSMINVLGCDSVYHFILRTLPTTKETINTSLVAGDSIRIGQKWYTTAGQYETKILNHDGCEHTVSLNISEAEQRLACENVQSFDIPFTSSNGNVSFTIEFNQIAKDAGFSSNNSTNAIHIAIPQKQPYLRPNDYVAYVYPANSARETDSVMLTIPLSIRYPNWIAEQHWNDMLSVLATDFNGGYEFSNFQWYADDEPIDGERNPYLYLPGGLNENVAYSVALTRKDDGKTFRSCPIYAKDSPGREGSNEPFVSVYPTLVAKGNPYVNILTNTSGKYGLYNSQGKMIEQGDFDNNMQIALPGKCNMYLFYFETVEGEEVTIKVIAD